MQRVLGRPVRTRKGFAATTGVAATLLAGVLTSLVTGISGPVPVAHAAAAPIEVLDGFCSLQDAIKAVNAKDTVGNCVNDPGDPTHVIRITTGSGFGVWRQQSFPGVFTPFDLSQGPSIGGGTTAYPSITTDVVIEGLDPNPVIDDRLSIMMDPGPILAGGTTRAFHVDTSGSLTLRNLNLLGFGVAGVGSTLDVEGGAIYAQGPVVLDHVTLAGNSATGKQPPRFGTRSPGDAQGGAIYSTSSVTATGSVFTDNRVTGSAARPASGFEWVEVANQLYRFSRDPNRNASGARGGNALGADVALGENGMFVATDTNFLSSRAFAGSGTPGEIDSGADNYGGGRLMDGSDGRDGDNVSCNDADDGNNGSNGNDGTNGGAAGDAAGVIYGGASVTLDHSSIVDALAIGGGAGKAGPPGIGGDGGDGGDAGTCGYYLLTFPGNGGDGGNGGSNGTPAFPGERATAVATIESTQHVTLVNTTIVASKAVVAADTTSPTLEAARVRALTKVGAAGQGGTGTGTNGADGSTGSTTAATMFSNDRSTGAGSAVALLSSANSLLSMSSSTIADVNLEFPSAADGRGDVIIKWITAASGSPAAGDGIMGSIAWSSGSDPLPCPNLGSGGYNVRRSCPSAVAPGPGEVFTFDSPLVQYPVPMGDVLRPPLYPTDAPYRMFVLPLKTGSVGIDVGAPSVSGTGCPAVGQATNSIFDDARHQPRENRCDAGAYEVDSTPAALEVIAPDSIWLRDKFGGLLVQVIIGPGTTLGAGATLTLSSNVANTRFTGPLEFDTLTFSMPLDESEPIPLYLPFEIFADTGAPLGPVTITATLEPGGAGAGTVVTATDTSVIHEDSRLEVTALQPSEVDTCSILDLTYVATASGRSQPADRNITVWPLQEVWNRPGTGGPTQQYVEHVLIGDDTTIMYNNGDLVERRAQVDLGGGLFEPFTFDPVMVRPMTEFLYLSFSGVPFDGTDYVMLPGQTLQVTTGLRNNNPTSPCGLINGVSSVRVIGLGADKQLLDAGEQAGGVEIEPNTGASDWRSWGGPLTAPMEPGNYTFWWELEIPGLDQPLIIPQQFVVQAVGVGVTPKTLESAEGDAGSSTREFDITLDTAANADVSVDWATADDTATAGSDYVAAGGTVTFAPGETSKTVAVTVTGDKAVESDENFLVRLTPPTGGLGGGARIERDVAATQLTNDDVPLPAFSIDDVTVTEGNSGTTTLTFTVQTDAPVGVGGIQLQLISSDDTATAGEDYVAIDVPVNFAQGDDSATVSVTVNGDLVDESDESFDVELTGPVPLTGQLTAIGTITDDDTAVSANDVAVTEGTGGGTTSAVLTLTLSAPADHEVTVDMETSLAAGSAQADDFVATSATVTFPAGSVQQQVTVPIVADSQPETDESVGVLFGNPAGGTLATAGALVQVADDDPWSVSGPATVNVTEGDPSSGPRVVQVTATLNAASPSRGVLVEYSTVDGTALAGTDYVARSGTLTFAAGETTAVVEIELIGDLTHESTETFSVVFSAVRFAPLATQLPAVAPAAVFGGGATVTVSVVDNDAVPPDTPANQVPPGTPATPLPPGAPAAPVPPDDPADEVPRGIPATGGEPLPWLQLAVAACALGAVLTFGARRRRQVGSLGDHV